MTSEAYIAVDLGAESGRVMLGELDGGRLTLHEAHRFANLGVRLPSGWHWDLTGLIKNITDGIALAIELARSRGSEPRSVGVDTWGVDYGLIGRSGELLGMPHCYRDERNGPAFEKVMEQVGRDRLYRATGIQFMALNTLFQLVAQYDAEPELVRAADRLLFMPDLIHFMLSGKAANEATIASTSQMIDCRSGAWAMELLESIGLPTRMLHTTVPAGATIGPLRPDLTDALRAPSGFRVVTPAAHDTASAVAAAPAAPSGDWAYLSSGTWSLLGAELREPCLTDAARDVPFTNEGGVDGTIRFLKNITGLWLVQECRRSFAENGSDYDYAELTRLAGDADSFVTLIDPSFGAFLTPGDMPGKIAEYARRTGQVEPSSIGACVRCCLESLALMYRRTLGQLEETLRRRFDVIHLLGGGGRNDLLNRMTAGATGRPVVVGPFEATATGNALVQAMGAGRIDGLGDIRAMVRSSFELQTIEPADGVMWEDALQRFNALLQEGDGDERR